MQEYSFDMSGGLSMGLTPDPLMPNSADYAATMKNLRPEAAWAGSPEALTDPTSSTMDWPFPMLLRDEQTTVKLSRTTVATLSEAYAATSQTIKLSSNQSTTSTLTGGTKWNFCAFDNLAWFATNGVDFIFKLPTYSNVLLADGVTCATLCRNGGHLFMAGLSGTWFSQSRFTKLFDIWRGKARTVVSDQSAWSDKWVMWVKNTDVDNPFLYGMLALGVFGTTLFDKFESEIHACIKSGDIGFASTKAVGTPRASLGLGGGIRVYGPSAIANLSPVDDGYSVTYDYGTGVKAFALSGDENEHAWIAPDGRLNHTTHKFAGGAFKWIFSSMTTPIMSFDRLRREHWISDGTYAYVLTADGKLGGPMTKCPTSMFRSDSALIAAHTNRTDSTVSVEYQSHPTNMNYLGSKRLQVIESVYDTLTSTTCDVSGKTGAAGTYTSMGEVQFNLHGVAWPRRSANMFKVSIKGAGSGRYGINSIVARYQSEDQRFRRGTVAPAPGA